MVQATVSVRARRTENLTVKSAIETHLHKITNMTNRWVYMNDDWAFTQKTCFQDFYADGATRIYTINSWV